MTSSPPPSPSTSSSQVPASGPPSGQEPIYTLIYDRLSDEWPTLKDQLMVQERIDPSDPLTTAETDPLTGDE